MWCRARAHEFAALLASSPAMLRVLAPHASPVRITTPASMSSGAGRPGDALSTIAAERRLVDQLPSCTA